MELLLLMAIIVLLILIYNKIDKGIEKSSSEIEALMKQMDQLLRRKEQPLAAQTTPVSVSKTPPIVVEVEEKSEAKEEKEEKEVEPAKEVKLVVQETYEAVPLLEPEVKREMKPEVKSQVKPAPIPVKQREKKQVNYEKFIGENLFGKIGILVFVVGIGLFVKYAIDKDWINETLRTVLGFVTGSALLAVAERLRKPYRTFSSLLAGGAFAVFYLTVAIAFHYYHLFSQPVAFVILVVLTILMSLLSILYDRRELAVISLVGGFLAPFLVSSGSGSYIVLFTYLAILNVGMFGLSVYKKWTELPVISFVFTYLVMGSYVLSQLVIEALPHEAASLMAGWLLAFVTLFYFIFLLPVLSILKSESMRVNRILLSVIVTNNFVYLGFGSLFLSHLILPFKAEGLLTLFVAVVNLILVIWLRRSKQDYKFLIYTMLGLVLTFVSITVPIQLDGHYITLFWASEMVLLLWLYIKSRIRVYELASFVLVALTLISFLMDAQHQLMNLRPTDTIFLNSLFVTSLYTGLAASAFALLLGRNLAFFATARLLKYNPWNGIMLISSAAILYYTFVVEFWLYLDPMITNSVILLFTSLCVLTLILVFRKRFPLSSHPSPYIIGMGLNVLLYLINVWNDVPPAFATGSIVISWVMVAVVIASLYRVSRVYYPCYGVTIPFTTYLNILATLCWLGMVHFFLRQLGLPDEQNAGFSVALAVAGFVQMGLGMRLHLKLMRVISLFTLGVVLLKLVLIDLWSMPTIGKIIVFIILGLILLILSFLYQKLKDVLFKDDNNEDTE